MVALTNFRSDRNGFWSRYSSLWANTESENIIESNFGLPFEGFGRMLETCSFEEGSFFWSFPSELLQNSSDRCVNVPKFPFSKIVFNKLRTINLGSIAWFRIRFSNSVRSELFYTLGTFIIDKVLMVDRYLSRKNLPGSFGVSSNGKISQFWWAKSLGRDSLG